MAAHKEAELHLKSLALQGPAEGDAFSGSDWGDSDDESDGAGAGPGSDAEEAFDAASAWVAASVQGGRQLAQNVQLQLYGLFKQATVGEVGGPRPGPFHPAKRAKWDAWAANGKMSKEEAMARYVALVCAIDPEWNAAQRKEDPSFSGRGSGGQGGGPVFSIPAVGTPGADDEKEIAGLPGCASRGDEAGVRGLLKSGAHVDDADEEGRTALHWASDGGRLEMAKLLLESGASPNVKDKEGATPLHYAATCDFEAVASELLKAGADPHVADADGSTPFDLKPKTWQWP